MPAVLINPAAEELGRTNAILSGTGRRYEVRGFPGPLSIKGVVRGAATWETAAGRFEVTPRTALILNDAEEYSLSIASPQPVETFCLFFARGFVDDAVRAAVHSSAKLLDAPAVEPAGFFERLHFNDALVAALHATRERFVREEPLDEAMYAVANVLAEAECDAQRRAEKLPALRASTREELRRRVEEATSFLHASLDRQVTIADAAREACLSPFHFHRLFAAFHRETPHRYLTRLRLERACVLLREADRPIAEVAFDCGFESVGSFTTLFTKRFGTPPGRFRRIEEERRRATR